MTDQASDDALNTKHNDRMRKLKAALADNRLGLPFITLAGRRGGSALAAAAVNALAGEEKIV